MPLQTNPSLTDLATEAKADLQSRFGCEAAYVVAAPGRVNLIGEHIDYCDGFVLPLAIDRHIVIAAAPNHSDRIRLRSAGEPEAVIPLDRPPEIGEPKWTNYLRGVLEGFRAQGHWPLPGFDAAIVSSLPQGGGLSSSAALELAFATLLEGLTQATLGNKEKALLCQKAEHDFAGVPCGIMDQFASTFGRDGQLVLIDCRAREPKLIPFPADDVSILIANTMTSHDLAASEYANRRRDTEQALAMLGRQSWREVTSDEVESQKDAMGDVIFRRARHVVSEIARTVQAASHLRDGTLTALGPLMAASHRSLRDDFEVSCRELDLMVALADQVGEAGGVLGSRMTGGGFGGSTVHLVRTRDLPESASAIAASYQAETGITPLLFASRPVEGARLL